MIVDLAAFITYFKEHAAEHGFHVHGERHFVESFSLRQSWEIDLHPEEACDGPLDLNLAFQVEPRMVLALEDRLNDPEADEPAEGEFILPMFFNWLLPSLDRPPDLLVLATELAAVGGPDLPIEIEASNSFGPISDSIAHQLSLVGAVEVDLVVATTGQDSLCEVLERCREVSRYLLERAEVWIGD